MSKIVVILGNMFEDVEYTEPAKVFKENGHELTVVGLKKGQKVKGKQGNASETIEKSFNDVSIDDFDALFIPGGHSPDELRVDEDAVEFTKEFVKSGKPVFAICHAPQILITAQVLEGRRITGWKSIIQDIKNAGATYVDEEVVEDGNIISSRSPDDIPAFIKASLKKLKE
ncbi:general stress protein 18 [Methanobrevibacter cuticularis]|uniref:General stress protein 18 n=1 Tax=Methanobrevibacter cuticularis TaxID=47311 RepID=A0A166CHD9_9EURY|nr:type 1 glutamine amidotransferase domain-containing protein [Methanobrevibacter cuticularis]KZX14509.1 general stress protein 18 [Methanobrevibacter cuticularis]